MKKFYIEDLEDGQEVTLKHCYSGEDFEKWRKGKLRIDRDKNGNITNIAEDDMDSPDFDPVDYMSPSEDYPYGLFDCEDYGMQIKGLRGHKL